MGFNFFLIIKILAKYIFLKVAYMLMDSDTKAVFSISMKNFLKYEDL